MKKILVPIDFSDYSINAFQMASYMAKVKGMQIKLLHIIEQPAFKLGEKNSDEYLSKVEAHTKEHLERLVSLEHTSGLNAEYEVRRSKAGIVKELLKENCDVIVMGRRRAENDQVMFFGSTAEKMVRLSSVPVITVGELPQHYSIKNIVFASDFEDEAQAPIIQRVKDLATIFNARLHFLYVVVNRDLLSIDKSRETILYRTSKFDLSGHDVEMVVADTEDEGLSQYMQETGSDLLALCTRGRSGLASFFLGSVAETVAAFAPTPVLTYNISKAKVEKASRPITRERIVVRGKENRPVK